MCRALLRRALALAVLVLCGAPDARAADTSALAFHRVEVTSDARVPNSLADRLRDELASRLPRRAGEPATLSVTILAVREKQPGDLTISAIVAARADAVREPVAEFDVEAHTRVAETTGAATQAALEAAQAHVLADQIIASLESGAR